jgi:hypothetical protein
MITKEEYLRLIEEAYRQDQDPSDNPIDCNAWIPAESPLKKKLPTLIGKIDATHLKKDTLKKAIEKCQQITVGEFMIHLTGTDTDEQTKFHTYNFYIYETKHQTASGRPCNIQSKVDVLKDDRFEKRPWLNYFNRYGTRIAQKVPENILIDIVRWLQAITKLPAFL